MTPRRHMVGMLLPPFGHFYHSPRRPWLECSWCGTATVPLVNDYADVANLRYCPTCDGQPGQQKAA